MSTTLANTYYLKALDSYPYDLPDFLEAIDYALSYDEMHADANYLMGRFCMEQLQKFKEAQWHFEAALASDLDHVLTYYHYIKLCVLTNQLDKAKRLIHRAKMVFGISKTELWHREGIILEMEKDYKRAMKKFKKAKQNAVYEEDCQFYSAEIKRLESKMPKRKKKRKKQK
jgi:tetratricopeptide (TPR) repeat protein